MRVFALATRHGGLRQTSVSRTRSKIVGGYNGPLARLRPLLCLAQRSFPLLAAVVLSALLSEDGIRNSEGAMRRAIVAGCIAGTVKLLRSGFADRAKERSGHLSTLVEATFCLSRVYRLFSDRLCQPGMSLDPRDSIFLRSEFPKKVHVLVRPRYPHAPNAARLYRWR